MNSLIIVSKNSETSLEQINRLCSKNKISNIDKDISTFDKAVGIEDVRNIQKKLYLKPIKSKDKAVVINASLGLTIEAQNALLKILEEPPSNTLIILVTSNKNALLPTVLSRCKIIEIKEDMKISDAEISEYQKILMSLSRDGVGEKLKLSQDFSKTKEEAILFLQNLIIAAREKLTKNPQDKTALKILSDFQKAYAIIKSTNATPRLMLENLLLNI